MESRTKKLSIHRGRSRSRRGDHSAWVYDRSHSCAVDRDVAAAWAGEGVSCGSCKLIDDPLHFCSSTCMEERSTKHEASVAGKALGSRPEVEAVVIVASKERTDC